MGTAFLLYNAAGWIATICICHAMIKTKKRQPPCDSCLYLRIKRKHSFSDFKYECKVPHEKDRRQFDRCPEFCGDYVQTKIIRG
jgi:hypothetical protein